MSVLFSKSCEYALQAVLFIGKEPGIAPIHLRDLSTALHIPHYFLSKILQILVHHEIIQSYKGQNGGFALARPGSEITINDIVQAIDGKSFLTHCVLGFQGCEDRHPCPVHDEWKEAKKIINSMVTERTINDLGRGILSKIDLLRLLSARQKQSTYDSPSNQQH